MSDKKVKAGDMVEITGTGESKFLALGVKKVVHQIVADKLLELGYATIGEAVAPKHKNKKGKEKLEM